MPKAVRPDDDTISLALRLIDDVYASPAVVNGLNLSVRTSVSPEGGVSVEFGHPDHRALRDLLGVVRKFDMKGHDARLDRVYPIIERMGVKPEWRESLARARAAWTARNDPDRHVLVQQPGEEPRPDPTPILPREAFEIWAYGEVIHDDYDKELKWRSLSALGQGLVRMLAHGYMNLLVIHAGFVGNLIRFALPGTPDMAPPAEVPGGDADAALRRMRGKP
jgi:hypothetical protein